MIPHLKISLDIDDTVAGFTEGYAKRFKTKPKYDWVISRNVNHVLIHDRDFWLNLPVIRRPNFTPQLWCSARINNRRWTKKFLEINEFPKAPLYQIPGYHLSKAKVLKGRCDVHIEDSIKNFLDLNSKGIPCLLIDNDINRYLGPILRIYTLDREEIEDAYWTAKEFGVFEEFNDIFQLNES